MFRGGILAIFDNPGLASEYANKFCDNFLNYVLE